MTEYMYHMVPSYIHGTVLHPLNQLKVLMPDVYEAAVMKYLPNLKRGRQDRTSLLERKIAYLGCRWNDVVHSSAVHPKDLKILWRSGKLLHPQPLRMYAIPIDMLDVRKIVIYMRTTDTHFRQGDFEAFNLKRYAKHQEVSDRIREKYRDMATTKGPRLLFSFIPHVLYCGSIDINGLEVIKEE